MHYLQEQRALGPGNGNRTYRRYEVLKPLPVLEGKIAPAFGKIGGGTQLLPNLPDRVNINWLIKNGYLKELK
ncbi:TNT domain-containing protein [Vibrio neptunius]|uniref:TNT domain-containing protein n=1 Tax=Vibrio neptunius TaxID=170651 RepID=UPI003315031F